MTPNDRSRLETDGGSGDHPWQVGTAARVITPEEPIRMAGYGQRVGLSEGVDMDLHVKVVAFEDSDGNRVVVVGAELLGISGSLCETIESTCEDEYGLDGTNLLLNVSHTHQGPEYREDRWGTWDLTDEQQERAHEYRDRLADEIIGVVGDALETRSSARLDYVPGTCGIAWNRRKPHPVGYQFRQYPDGVVDHDVPVLVATEDETVIAILFGYASHPTSLDSHRRFHGDWAGHAMENLEEEFPRATATFVQGCGGDIKAYPQDGPERTEQHGRSLSNAVHAAIDAGGTEVHGPLRTCTEEVTFQFEGPHSRDELEAMIREEDPVHMKHVHDSRENLQGAMASRLLQELDETGTIDAERPYPIQVIGFGDDLTMLGLPGEVVVDYSVRIKAALEGNVWVAGYSNKGYFYVPSRQDVYEGGYESGWVSVYSDCPGYPAADNEERIVGKSLALAERVGARRSGNER